MKIVLKSETSQDLIELNVSSRGRRLFHGAYTVVSIDREDEYDVSISQVYLKGRFNIRNKISESTQLSLYFPFRHDVSNYLVVSSNEMDGSLTTLTSAHIVQPLSSFSIYLAGPFFSPSQIVEQTLLYNFLSSLGYTVRCALQNGINLSIAYQTLQQYISSSRELSEHVYYLNIATACYDIQNALLFGDITVANVGPLVPSCSTNEDSGTVIEIAYSACFQHGIVFWNSYPARILPNPSNANTGFPNPMMILSTNMWNLNPSTLPLQSYCTDSLAILQERLFHIVLEIENGRQTPQKNGFPVSIQNQVDLGYQISQITQNQSGIATNFPLLEEIIEYTKHHCMEYNILPWNQYDFSRYWIP